MEIFQHRYYNLNKLLLKSIGQWPYQSKRVRSIIITFMTFSAISLTIPQIIAFVGNSENWDRRMESATSFIYIAFCSTMCLVSTINSQKMLMLLNHISMDWKICAQDSDVHILHEYADNGRKLTIMYTVMGYTTCVLYICQPAIPKIIDILLKNGTETGQFPAPVDYYFFDEQEYYFYIILHCWFASSIGYIISIACSSMFIVYVYHGCALFAMLGTSPSSILAFLFHFMLSLICEGIFFYHVSSYQIGIVLSKGFYCVTFFRRKIERIGIDDSSVETGNFANGLVKSNTAFEYLVSCIKNHNHAIEYAELLEATYSWYFFFIVGCSAMLISIVGVEITVRSTEPEETLRYISAFGVVMIHLYVDSYMAQRLMDHSVSILNYIFNSKWYTLPIRAQKLLPLMMMRCSICCKLSAAKMIIISIESYGVILKTSLSYFTLLRSA